MRRAQIVLLALVTACHNYRPSAAVPEGENVQFRFPSARALRITLPDRSVIDYGDVVIVRGRVNAVRGDTVELRVTGIRRSGGWVPAAAHRSARATLLTGGDSHPEVRSLSAGKSAFAVVGVAGGLTLVLFLLALAQYASSD
jgi:hypothetical protein